MAGRTAVGLDIGTTSVRAAQLSTRRGVLTLERFGQVALPPGAVREGEVVDVPTVAAALRRLWSSAKFSTKKITLGLANQKVVVRQVDLPRMSTEELRKSLPFHVSDFLPMPLEHAILDFHPIGDLDGDSGPQSRILLVAASREVVLSAMAAVERAGLSAVRVDLTAFAMIRAVARPDETGLDRADAEAIVDIGSRVTNILVHRGGVPLFVRILLMGGDTVTDAVAERLGVPFEEAEAVKCQLGLAPTAGAPLPNHPAHRVLESVGGSLLDEIRGSIDYYTAQPGAAQIRRLQLSGGGALLTSLAARLAAATRLPVEPARLFDTLRPGRTGLSPEQLAQVESFAVVPVGLAMGVAS